MYFLLIWCQVHGEVVYDIVHCVVAPRLGGLINGVIGERDKLNRVLTRCIVV